MIVPGETFKARESCDQTMRMIVPGETFKARQSCDPVNRRCVSGRPATAGIRRCGGKYQRIPAWRH
jgi:hypothetical protein